MPPSALGTEWSRLRRTSAVPDRTDVEEYHMAEQREIEANLNSANVMLQSNIGCFPFSFHSCGVYQPGRLVEIAQLLRHGFKLHKHLHDKVRVAGHTHAPKDEKPAPIDLPHAARISIPHSTIRFPFNQHPICKKQIHGKDFIPCISFGKLGSAFTAKTFKALVKRLGIREIAYQTTIKSGIIVMKKTMNQPEIIQDVGHQLYLPQFSAGIVDRMCDIPCAPVDD